MTHLYRPYIPLKVRCRVALRQLGEVWHERYLQNCDGNYGLLLKGLLGRLALMLKAEKLELDHDPALVLREQHFVTFKGKMTLKFTPDANDPEYLVYRPDTGHRHKTHGVRREDSPEFSDRVLMKRQRRRERPKRKKLWPSRPFPKRSKHVHE